MMMPHCNSTVSIKFKLVSYLNVNRTLSFKALDNVLQAVRIYFAFTVYLYYIAVMLQLVIVENSWSCFASKLKTEPSQLMPRWKRGRSLTALHSVCIQQQQLCLNWRRLVFRGNFSKFSMTKVLRSLQLEYIAFYATNSYAELMLQRCRYFE